MMGCSVSVASAMHPTAPAGPASGTAGEELTAHTQPSLPAYCSGHFAPSLAMPCRAANSKERGPGPPLITGSPDWPPFCVAGACVAGACVAGGVTSTQLPDWHSMLVPQGVPSALCTVNDEAEGEGKGSC